MPHSGTKEIRFIFINFEANIVFNIIRVLVWDY